jgi:hypothetical protein
VQDYCCVFGTSAADLWVAGSHTSADQYVLSHFSSGAWTRINPTQTAPARMVPQALTGLREGMVTTVQLVGQSLLVKTDSNQFPTVVPSAIANQPRGAAINAGLVGFLVGQGGSIGRSANGQLSGYTAVPSPTTSNLRDLFATPDGTLIAVGEGGTTLTRTQGVWKVESAVTTVSLNRVWGTSSTNVWAVGDAGTILSRVVK